MNKLSDYARTQKTIYERISEKREEAEAAVMPNYHDDVSLNNSRLMAHRVLQEHFSRNNTFYALDADFDKDLKLIDFGCGVGRMIVAFNQLGVNHVDGVDISEHMLRHAQDQPGVQSSSFYLSSGVDAGDAPENHYDVAYSFLCFHHIPIRQTRIKLLEALAKKLKPGGTVYIELKIFPGITPNRIPHNHADWPDNMVATGTNSANDVWVTPATLGMVYDDFNLFFSQIQMTELKDDQDTRKDIGEADFYRYDPNQIYQYRFNKLYVSGSKR